MFNMTYSVRHPIFVAQNNISVTIPVGQNIPGGQNTHNVQTQFFLNHNINPVPFIQLTCNSSVGQHYSTQFLEPVVSIAYQVMQIECNLVMYVKQLMQKIKVLDARVIELNSKISESQYQQHNFHNNYDAQSNNSFNLVYPLEAVQINTAEQQRQLERFLCAIEPSREDIRFFLDCKDCFEQEITNLEIKINRLLEILASTSSVSASASVSSDEVQNTVNDESLYQSFYENDIDLSELN